MRLDAEDRDRGIESDTLLLCSLTRAAPIATNH